MKQENSWLFGGGAELPTRKSFQLGFRKEGKMTMRLVDGVRRNREHPETFRIPSRTEKGRVEVGNYVKVGFMNRRGSAETVDGERMWVLVTGIEGRKYFGTLHNEPVSFPQEMLKYGDAVEFEARHILDIIQ